MPELDGVGTLLVVSRTSGEKIAASIDDIPELANRDDVVIWYAFSDSGELGQRVLRDRFSIHPLLIEDALFSQATPKIETLDSYVYLNIHGLLTTAADETPRFERFATSDIDFFISPNFCLVHHRGGIEAVERVSDELIRSPAMLAKGPAFVAHRVIDGVIDAFLPLMERFDRQVSALEEDILRRSDDSLVESIFLAKQSISRINRIAMHQRNLLERLWKDESPFVDADMRPFFRDVYDHFLRVFDWSTHYRDHVSTLMDAYLGIQSHRLNEVMRTLTIISTVMLPLTFITGLYGMNFDKMPLIHWRYGWEFAWLLMLISAAGFFMFIRRRRWL